jgi:hypothetical protein
MDLQHIAFGEVKPCQDNEFIASFDACHSWRDRLMKLQPGCGRTFVPLHGRILKPDQLRADNSNRCDRIRGRSHLI